MVVRIHVDAEAELEEAFDYYQRRRPGLGHDFLDQYLRGTRTIAEAPHRWPVHPADARVRHLRLDIFPFSLVYQVRSDHCTIIAVAHTHRRPGYWRDRIQ